MRLAAALQAALPPDFKQSFAEWVGGSMAGAQQQPALLRDPYYSQDQDWHMQSATVGTAAGTAAANPFASPPQVPGAFLPSAGHPASLNPGDTVRALGLAFVQERVANGGAIPQLDAQQLASIVDLTARQSGAPAAFGPFKTATRRSRSCPLGGLKVKVEEKEDDLPSEEALGEEREESNGATPPLGGFSAAAEAERS